MHKEDYSIAFWLKNPIFRCSASWVVSKEFEIILSGCISPTCLGSWCRKSSQDWLCPWGFSRQEYWSGLPCPPPGDLPNPGIKPRSPEWQADSLLSEPPGKPLKLIYSPRKQPFFALSFFSVYKEKGKQVVCRRRFLKLHSHQEPITTLEYRHWVLPSALLRSLRPNISFSFGVQIGKCIQLCFPYDENPRYLRAFQRRIFLDHRSPAKLSASAESKNMCGTVLDSRDQYLNRGSR